MLSQMFEFLRRRRVRADSRESPPAARRDDATPALSCSFCGKSQREVRKLIGGPAVYICDGCIRLCNDILAEEIPAQKSSPPPALCERCSTPLAEGRCATCDAGVEGLELITRSGYASVRAMASLLELEGLSPEMEKVPPARPEEKVHPLWNLYVPQHEVRRAAEFLREDWAKLLDQPAAADAAARGQQGIDLDTGGVVTCPACAHQFSGTGGPTECPECGLGLGAAANAAPDEGRSS